jgi:hypothetical protein
MSTPASVRNWIKDGSSNTSDFRAVKQNGYPPKTTKTHKHRPRRTEKDTSASQEQLAAFQKDKA